MNSFLDSNVIIGHIFCLDSHFEISNEFFFKSDNNFYSYNVQREVNEVFIRKNFELSKFLFDVFHELEKFNDSRFLSSGELHHPISHYNDIGKLKVDEMHELFDKIWDYFDFGENQEVFIIKLEFREFLNNFEGNHRLRKRRIFKNLTLVSNHTKKDQNILHKIKQENLNDVLLHNNDEDILFDANEFACKNPDLDLKFVSADDDFVEAINILMDYLCFNECINLKEFTNN